VSLLNRLLPAVLLTGAAFGQVTINGIANQSVTGISGTSGTTYYVDASGGADANDGKDPGRAWKTVSKVNGSTFSALDKILFKRGEVWRETLTIPSSGTSGNPITFGAYGTDTTLPTFYGADTVTGAWTLSSGSIYWATWTFASNNVFQDDVPLLKKTALASVTGAGQFFYDAGASRLYVRTTDSVNPSTKVIEASTNGPNFYGIIRGLNKDNIIIENLRAVKTNYTGIYCEECDNVVVRGNTLEQNFQNNITFVGNLGQANPTNIYVDSNTILNSGTGRGLTGGAESECVGINMQGVQTGTVSNNYISGEGGEGIQTNGGSTNVTITGNTIINPYATGIYLGAGWGNGGNVTGAVASWNYIELGALSISPALTIATEHATDAVNGFYVHHNILKGKNTAIGCLLYGQGSFAGGINNGHVHHNVCTNDQYGFKLLGPTTSTNNTFSNNIISVTNNGRAYWINTAPSVGSNPITNYAIDYDDVFSPSVASFIVEMPTSTFYTLAQWIANTAHADHAVATDPLFVDSASDWHVSTGSPAINAGVTVSSVDQYVVGTAPDMGAYEFSAPTYAQRVVGYIPDSTASGLTTLGDLLYYSTTNARLAGNTTSTKKFLTQTGTGSVSAAPAWGTIAAGDVPTLNQSTSGNAATATALAANPADCSSNQYATTIAANGDLTCAQVAYSQISSTPTLAANTTATSSNFFTAYNSTTGAFTKAQPAFTDISGSVAASQMPALTGDATTSAGTVAVTVSKINGTSLAGLATGVLKNTTTTGVPSIAAASDIVALFSTCSGVQYLGADGACHSLSGSISGLTTGTIPQAASSTTISDSNLSQDGTTGQIVSAKSISSPFTTVSFSATPTFNAALGNVFQITLTNNVTSSTLSNPKSGEVIVFKICQDGTGSRTFAWPSNVSNPSTVDGTASGCTQQTFVYDGTNAVPITPGFVTGVPGSAITLVGSSSGSTLVQPAAAAGGTWTVPAATDTVVGKATTDTLTNKTLTTPTIASFTNATHDHSNAAGGGVLGVAAVAGAPMMSWSANLGGTGVTASTTVFFKAYSGSTTTTTETTQYWSTAWAGTLKGLYIRTTGTQPNSTCVCTVRVNAVDTTIIATVTANAVAGTFSDTTHTAAVAANDKISLKCVQGTSLSATMGDFSLGMTY
jgi:hypothetical protein